MQRNMLADRIGGIIAVIVGMVSIMEAIRLFPMRTTMLVGDHTLPLILGACMVLLGLLLIFFIKVEAFKVQFPDRKLLSKMILVLGLMFVYWLFIPILGYVISTLLVSMGLFKVIGTINLFRSAFLATVTTMVLYTIFIYWLHMPFPVGIFNL